MTRTLPTVADAVTRQLNEAATAGDFDVEFDAKRVQGKRKVKLEELENYVVDVVPRELNCSLATRGAAGFAPIVDIFIRRKAGRTEQTSETGEIENEELDAMAGLAEDIAVSFQPEQPDRDGILQYYDTAVWRHSQIVTAYVTDKFTQHRIIQSQIRLTFDI